MSEAKIRSASSDVNINFFGLINFVVDVLPAKVSSESIFTMVCPTCEEPHKVEQFYHCTADPKHGPFKPATVHRAVEVDGTLRKVTQEEIDAVKAPTIEAKTATFRVFPASDIEQHTAPGDQMYVLRPKIGVDAYSLLVDVVSNPKHAYVCELIIRNVQKLYRCIERHGALALVELVRPGEFREIEVATASYEADLLDAATRLADTRVEEFDPEAFLSLRRLRAEQLIEAKRDPNSPAPETLDVAGPKTDSLANLRALIEAEAPQPAKRPARKAPAKKATKRPAKKAAAKTGK